MIVELQQNDAFLFDCFTSISTPFKQKNEMETNTISYFYNDYKEESYHFDFINNPYLSTLSKVDKLLSLNNNWDGYNAVSVFPKAADNAKIFIEFLDLISVEKISDIYPSTHGTITFEWENGEDKKMALEIGSNSYSYFVLNSNKQPILADGKNISVDFTKITREINNVLRQNEA